MVRRARMYTTSEQFSLNDVENEVNEFLEGIAPEDIISNQIVMAPIQHIIAKFVFVAVITYIGEVEEE